MTPRASFVIPAYNAERWVSKTILSCRAQTIKQIEIIVVNDGSTDDTKEIINWHAKEDKRVIPVHLEKNAGRSAARNTGNMLACSDLILVLDSDDMATRNRVKDTLAIMELKKPDIVHGSFFQIDSLGNVHRKFISEPFDIERAKTEKMNFICHSTMAYTKKVANAVKYESGEYSKLGLDDWKFQLDAHKQGFVFKHLKTPLCYYRMTEDGISATRNPEDVAKVKDEYLAVL
jgi:glycosyltransferase involved in cell wall biosynthesis